MIVIILAASYAPLNKHRGSSRLDTTTTTTTVNICEQLQTFPVIMYNQFHQIKCIRLPCGLNHFFFFSFKLLEVFFFQNTETISFFNTSIYFFVEHDH